MNNSLTWWIYAVIIGSGLLTWAVMPWVARLAEVVGAMDRPVWRSVHRKVTPRWGGLGIVAGALLGSIAVACWIVLYRWPLLEPSSMQISHHLAMGVFCGAAVIFVMGLIDDVKTLEAKDKLLVQILGAAFIVAGGVGCASFDLLGLAHLPLGLWGLLFTTVWILAAINSVNLMDGVDGLVGGLSGLTFIGCSVVAAINGHVGLAFFAAVWAAACAGYLPHNWNPARIFMGDSGSQLLGCLQGVLVWLVFRDANGELALIPALMFMALPMGDTVAVMLRRIAAGEKIFNADKRHLHHQLLARGLNAKSICVVLWSVHLAFIATAIWISMLG